MSSPVTINPPGSYRNERDYPFCPGCGHGPILDALNKALVMRASDPARIVIVSDIGCAGLSDQYFATSAFHGLHGRSITYATGIKLARPELDVIVVMGDGGAGIGGAHLINAARRNVGITVIVFNNLNFGMTGGQHSVTTPPGAVTTTTPGGSVERPLDICGTVGVNGACYVYRGTSFDEELADRMADAVAADGFALLDVWELCSAYFVRANRFGKRSITATLAELEFETGVLWQRDPPAAATAGPPPAATWAGIEAEFTSSLAAPVSVVLAGAAGGRVRSAARHMGRAAIMAGLWAAQRDDYPVTVKTGHSISTVILSPSPIEYTGVTSPDVLVLLSPEGVAKTSPLAAAMGPQARLYAVPECAPAATGSDLRVLDPARSATRLGKADLALAAVAAVGADLGVIPGEALQAAVRSAHPDHAARLEAIIAAGPALLP